MVITSGSMGIFFLSTYNLPMSDREQENGNKSAFRVLELPVGV